jgi:GxxExxY protein
MNLENLNEEELAHLIIGKSIEIHKHIGPGLDKSCYLECMKWELEQEGIPFRADIELDIRYKGQILEKTNTIDFLIADCVVFNVVADEDIPEAEVQRALKLVRTNDYRLGLVINFHSTLLKNGIRRVSNNKGV